MEFNFSTCVKVLHASASPTRRVVWTSTIRAHTGHVALYHVFQVLEADLTQMQQHWDESEMSRHRELWWLTAQSITSALPIKKEG